jgi:hypothetical protein
MGVVRVSDCTFDGNNASSTVTVGGESFRLSICSRSRIPSPPHLGDVWLPMALFPAMHTGQTLVLDCPISDSVRRGVGTIQKILSTWYSDLQVIEVRAPRRRSLTRRKVAVAQLFTGGVDSFYTLSQHDEVSALLYVHDLVYDTPGVTTRIHELLGSVARRKGTRLLEFDSDVRSMLDRYGEWGTQTHGAALASISSLVSGRYGTTLLPATHTYRDLYPWGSHPLLDHLWSGDRQELIHDGADATRFQKIERVSHDPVALEHLRVCWMTNSEINCSRCEKCLRTMTSLEILGVLSDALTFNGPLELDAMRAVELKNESDLSFALENRDAALAAGRVEIVAALNGTIADYDCREARIASDLG